MRRKTFRNAAREAWKISDRDSKTGTPSLSGTGTEGATSGGPFFRGGGKSLRRNRRIRPSGPVFDGACRGA